MKSVSAKMGIKPGARALLINAPTEAVQAIELPALELETNLQGDFDYIHLFAVNQATLRDQLPTLKDLLKQTGTLWVSWPKGGQMKTDLTLPKVIEIGYEYGLVESKCLSVDSTWSALKFTHPRERKIYNNRYGKLNL